MVVCLKDQSNFIDDVVITNERPTTKDADGNAYLGLGDVDTGSGTSPPFRETSCYVNTTVHPDGRLSRLSPRLNGTTIAKAVQHEQDVGICDQRRDPDRRM